MKDWEVVADNLKKAGWSSGYVSAVGSRDVGVESVVFRRATAVEDPYTGKIFLTP